MLERSNLEDGVHRVIAERGGTSGITQDGNGPRGLPPASVYSLSLSPVDKIKLAVILSTL